jgi:gluconate kinase
LVKTFGHGRACLQQHNAFINPTNLFFANHGLHPNFDIQCVNKFMNLEVEDRTMWLVDVRVKFVSNLEKTQK